MKKKLIDKIRETGIDVHLLEPIHINSTEGKKVLEELDKKVGKYKRHESSTVPVKSDTPKPACTAAEDSRELLPTVPVKSDTPKSECAGADKSSTGQIISIEESGAKVMKSFDNLIIYYQKSYNYAKGFITDIADALGFTVRGKSRYRTFELLDGTYLTVRLSKHNATVSNFDNNDEYNAISIVISSFYNNKLKIKGDKAHVVEFFYSKKDIESIKDYKPLVEILKSLRNALITGVYIDTTGLGIRQEVNAEQMMFMILTDRDYMDIKYNSDFSFMRDRKGQLYGFTIDDTIYLTEKGFDEQTMVHEFTHLWAKAMQYGNPEGWQSVKDLLKDTSLWDEVQNDPNYNYIKDKEDAITSEALARISGKENAGKLMAIAQKTVWKDSLKGIETKPYVILNKLKNAVSKFWGWIGKHMFDIQQFYSIGEITDRVLYDLLRDKKLETGKVLHQAQAPTPQDSRISHIQVFRGRGGHPHIRCKVDGVQQMGVPVKPQDLDAVHDKSRLPELAERYFQNELNRTESHNHTIRL